jgi:hypothetical protein
MAPAPLFIRSSIADGPVFGSPQSTAICAPCGRWGLTGVNVASSIAVIVIPATPAAQRTSQTFMLHLD